MQGVHQLRNAYQQHHGREHLTHDDKAQEQVPSLKAHTCHGVSRRNAANHSNRRCAGSQQHGVQQILQHATVANILQVAPYPLGRQHVQEVHVRGFRITAEGSDEHHVEGIQDKEADNDDEQVQGTTHQRILQLAVAQVGNAAQQHQHGNERRRNGPVDLDRQTLQQIQQRVACLAVVEEGIQVSQQCFILDVSPYQQIHLTGEGVDNCTNKCMGGNGCKQCSNTSQKIQLVCFRRQFSPGGGQCAVTAPEKQCQADQQHEQPGMSTAGGTNTRHAGFIAEGSLHEVKTAAGDGLLHRESYHRGSHALRVDPLRDGFFHIGAFIFRCQCFNLSLCFQILFVPHEGVGTALHVNIRLEGNQRQRKGYQDYCHAAEAENQHRQIFLLAHARSSFRREMAMYRPATAHKIRKPITESAVAGPFFWS